MDLLITDPATDPEAATPLRRFGPGPGRPNARAVVGGAMVALAMLGAFLVATNDTTPPAPDRVVAARPLAPGDVLAAEDLATVPALLPDRLDDTTHASVDEVVGSVVLGPVGTGELLQRSAVRPAGHHGGDGPTPELTISLEPSRALGGRVQAGERVDLLATYGTGIDAQTVVAASGTTVLESRSGEDVGPGPTGTLVVTLALASPDEVLAVAHAVEVGQVRLARTDLDGGDRTTSYRTPEPAHRGGRSEP